MPPSKKRPRTLDGHSVFVKRLHSLTSSSGPPDPVAAFVVSNDRRLRQAVLTLAASAGVRVQPLPAQSSPGQLEPVTAHAPIPRVPLVLFGADASPTNTLGAPSSQIVTVSLGDTNPGDARNLPRFYLPQDEESLLKLLTHAANSVCRSGTVIEVRGAVGGAGCTSAALLLATAATLMGHDVTVVDSGVGPPSMELILGLEGKSAPRWGDLVDAGGNLRDLPHPQALRLALPRWQSLRVLSRRAGTGPVSPDAVSQVASSLAREPGLIIMDVGTHLPDTPSPGAGRGCDVSVLVVPRTVSAVVQANEVLTRGQGRRPLVLTRSRRGSVLMQRDIERALPGKIIGEIPEISALQNLADRGMGLPAPRARFWRGIRGFVADILSQVGAA